MQDEIPRIDCPVLAFYGDQDTGLIQSLPKLKEDMTKSGKNFEAVVYPNAGHAFFNDTNARMYNPAAAKDAWEKVLTFLKKNLKA
jgi:carboxymethylenebutenolidase